jgi:hypothetical protein
MPIAGQVFDSKYSHHINFVNRIGKRTMTRGGT